MTYEKPLREIFACSVDVNSNLVYHFHFARSHHSTSANKCKQLQNMSLPPPPQVNQSMLKLRRQGKHEWNIYLDMPTMGNGKGWNIKFFHLCQRMQLSRKSCCNKELTVISDQLQLFVLRKCFNCPSCRNHVCKD